MSRFTVLRKICNDIELDVHKSLILLTLNNVVYAYSSSYFKNKRYPT